MKVIWDGHKNQINIKKHKLDFKDAIKVFNQPMITAFDDRIDYKEERYIGFGFLESLIVYVVFTENIETGVLRLISARKATKNERKKFIKEISNRLG